VRVKKNLKALFQTIFIFARDGRQSAAEWLAVKARNGLLKMWMALFDADIPGAAIFCRHPKYRPSKC
jgi:hypothetical protein